MIDYGDIILNIRCDMSMEHKLEILRLALDNQLFVDDESIVEEIFDQCRILLKYMDQPIDFVFSGYFYKFKIKIQYLETPGSCL